MKTRILVACIGLPLLLAGAASAAAGHGRSCGNACVIAASEMLWRTGMLQHKRLLAYTAYGRGA
ncbi:MAG: hypothetical protein V8T01_01975 [Oscillospiraceae bacterium]